MKRFISVLLSALIIANTIAIFAFSSTAYAATYAQSLKDKGFPDSYIPYLVSLHEKYPNWVFEPLNTGLDWQTAVNGERSSHGKQLIEKSSIYPSNYFCTCSNCYKNGSYVIREGSNWVAASETAVKYYMDPRNFLNEQYIFQFESTAYDGTQSKSGVEAILDGTWMHNSLIQYVSTQGKTVYYDTSTKYSDAIMNAANASGMSAYYLASKIRQENGGTTASATAVKGTASPFIGTYNYFNIGANTGAYQGLAFAAGYLKLKTNATLYSSYDSSTKTAGGTKTSLSSGQYMTWISTHGNYFYVRLYTENSSNSYTAGKTGYVLRSAIRDDYTGSGASGWGRPWSNPYKSIYWGSKYIANNFSTQNSGYLQKFNVSPSSSNKYNHEYMANVSAAASEARTTYNAYKSAGILSLTKKFSIPVFNNMPSSTGKTGWDLQGDTWYYYDTDGSMHHGWLKYKNNWYYLDDTGAMRIGWFKINDKWYSFDSSGAMRTGWYTNGDKRYYLTASGAMQTGWMTLDGKTYYFNASGSMRSASWLKYNNKWYYFNVNGTMRSQNWFLYKDNWYYFNVNGTVRTGWLLYKDNWYYLASPDGEMTTGWQKVKGLWYYMDEDGIMQTGWIELKGKKYYLTDSGAMATKSIELDGMTYTFTKSGALDNTYETSDTIVNVTSVTSPASKSIHLVWEKPPIKNSGYQIMWSTTKDFSSNFLAKTSGYANKLDYDLTTSQSGKTYYVKVRAYAVAYNENNERDDIYFPWSETIAVSVK